MEGGGGGKHTLKRGNTEDGGVLCEILSEVGVWISPGTALSLVMSFSMRKC